MSVLRDKIKEQYPDIPDDVLDKAEIDHNIMGECFIEVIERDGKKEYRLIDPEKVWMDAYPVVRKGKGAHK